MCVEFKLIRIPSGLCSETNSNPVIIANVQTNSILVIAILGAFVGFGVVFVRRLSRKYTSRGLAFMCLGIFGMAMMGLTARFATEPSSAPRVTVQGRCAGFEDISARSNPRYLFILVRGDGSQIPLETQITPPLSDGSHIIQQGESLQVTYLNDDSSNKPQRAISLKILSGENRGWSESRNANWLGAWLLFPAGLIVCAYGCYGMFRNRRMIAPSADARGDDKSEIVDLGL